MIHRTRADAIRDRKGRPFATITAYDAAFGRAAEAGGVERAERIAAVVNAGIPVIAHIGVVPQTAALDRGFRRRKDRERLLADADAIAAAGAFAVVLEMVDHAIAREITERIAIPTIGIGSGGGCDAQ